MADNMVPAEASEEDPDILRFDSEAEAASDERIPLFYIDDKPYTVPKHPSPNVGLRYLKIMHDEGAAQAEYWMLSNLLGMEGYDALMDYEKLTQAQYDAVLLKANKIMMAERESPKARLRGLAGRRK